MKLKELVLTDDDFIKYILQLGNVEREEKRKIVEMYDNLRKKNNATCTVAGDSEMVEIKEEDYVSKSIFLL